MGVWEVMVFPHFRKTAEKLPCSSGASGPRCPLKSKQRFVCDAFLSSDQIVIVTCC